MMRNVRGLAGSLTSSHDDLGVATGALLLLGLGFAATVLPWLVALVLPGAGPERIGPALLLSGLAAGLIGWWAVRRQHAHLADLYQTQAQYAATVEDLTADLEARVADRTAELEVAIGNLHAQMSQRARAEAALRDSEDRYRRLVELSPEPIVVYAEGGLAYVNQAGVRLFGASGPDELLNTPPLDLVHPDCRDEIEAYVDSLRHAGTQRHLLEVRMLRLDGTPVDVEVAAVAVTFNGQPAIQAVIRDVAERKAIERMKDEFLSTISHELRTPLTSIRGSLGLLAGGVFGAHSPQVQRMVEIAVNNTDRVIRLLNDILDLERMRAGRVSFAPRRCDAAELLDQVVAELRPLAETAGVQLVRRRGVGSVHADPDRMVQVLTNLTSNAIKFSPRGATVELAAERERGQVRFSVRDYGRGIPAEMLERIFERFQQVYHADARNQAGSGLGLAICKSIVEQQQGRIWADSALGQGSMFYVELPSAAEIECVSEPAAVPPPLLAAA